jgi:hypothetical protein
LRKEIGKYVHFPFFNQLTLAAGSGCFLIIVGAVQYCGYFTPAQQPLIIGSKQKQAAGNALL